MNETKYFKDALELQVEAKKIGLDWLTTDGIILKLQEETFEVSEEIKKNNKTSIKEELGDLLFTFICLARHLDICLLYTSPSPRDLSTSRMPSSA